MFKCEKCKKQIAAGEKQYKIVIEKREKRYKNKVKKGKDTIEFMTMGEEIVKEIGVCYGCVESVEYWNLEKRK